MMSISILFVLIFLCNLDEKIGFRHLKPIKHLTCTKLSHQIRRSYVPSSKHIQSSLYGQPEPTKYPYNENILSSAVRKGLMFFYRFSTALKIFVRSLVSRILTITITQKEKIKIQSLPYLLFINRKAGGQLGKRLLNKLYTLIDRESICDLLYENPSSKLNISQMIGGMTSSSSIDCSLYGKAAVCCGGDGTVRWIMDVANKLNISQDYAFGIIPLGTGNDLYQHILQSYYPSNTTSHEAKWSLNHRLQPSNQLLQPLTSLQLFYPPYTTHTFDRWQIQMQKATSNSSISSSISSNSNNVISFNNYFGLGIDGDITCTYDSIRKQRPYLFVHRLVNKGWFMMVWIYKFFREPRKNLSKDIQLFIDDQLVDIKELGLKGVILSNIVSYAGGTRLWTFGDSNNSSASNNIGDSKHVGPYRDQVTWLPQSSEDGLIEVVGLTSLTHLAEVKVGLAKPLPLGQGKRVKIITKVRLPMQVDGEPLIESPSIIDVSLLEKVQLIAPRLPTNDSDSYWQ